MYEISGLLSLWIWIVFNKVDSIPSTLHFSRRCLGLVGVLVLLIPKDALEHVFELFEDIGGLLKSRWHEKIAVVLELVERGSTWVREGVFIAST